MPHKVNSCAFLLRVTIYLGCWIAIISHAFGGDSFTEIIQPVFEKNCISCHGQDGKVKGKVNLLELDSLDALSNNLDLVSELIDVIDFEEMPPEDEPQLEAEKRKQLLAELQTILKQEVSGKKQFPHAPIRRMNRFQYHNAVTDLFDLKVAVFTLPERMLREHRDYFQPASGKMADEVFVGSRPLGKSQLIEKRLAGVAPFPQDLRAEHGYDNRGDHLSLSPLLMESFLKLSQSITHSKDFEPRNVGIWNTFFLEPKDKETLNEESRRRIESFLNKAFRRPVEDELINRYVNYFEGQLESGVSYTVAMKNLAAAAIASPKFLYLYDFGTGGTSADSFELASRLSFFLWGSLPDDDLLRLATSGELQKPEVLLQQFERMIADKKLKRFCDSFPAQWLQLDRIISATPNRKEFPKFYFSKYRASMHMMAEPLLLFETVLIENQPITQLIHSDFTYRSEMLQKAYDQSYQTPKGEDGKPIRRGGGVGQLNFYRTPVDNARNGGVITNAAIMTMLSGPEHTQPITRGAWLAGVIFNNPPEPPPADVPTLGEKPPKGEEHLTLRERLSAHRERSDCKGCHEQIDPLGFALENYDPVGKWREKYENGRDIDMAGTLFRKYTFDSIEEFKNAIMAEKDRFTRGFAGHLLSFALARKIGPADQPALDQITKATAADDYRIQTLLKNLILSEPFQSKSNPKSLATSKP